MSKYLEGPSASDAGGFLHIPHRVAPVHDTIDPVSSQLLSPIQLARSSPPSPNNLMTGNVSWRERGVWAFITVLGKRRPPDPEELGLERETSLRMHRLLVPTRVLDRYLLRLQRIRN